MQGAHGAFRSDLSCTVFLNDPDSYDGGALQLRLGSAEIEFKGPPGFAIVYPSTTLHRVEPVSAGERLVAISFIQSRVADSAKRELLYELGEVAALEGLSMDPVNYTKLQWVQSNLLRQWMDTP
jgi:PKHD-type hydroxylase